MARGRGCLFRRTSVTTVGPPGLGVSAAGREEALERRRRRLVAAAGFDPGNKTQAELFTMPPAPRADRWTIFWRWTPAVSRIICPVIRKDSNPWTPHTIYLHCTTERIAKNAMRRLKRSFPGKQFRIRPSRWVGFPEPRFPSAS